MKSPLRITLTILALCIFQSAAEARSPDIVILGKDQGLPSPFVRALLREADGTIWAALKAPQKANDWLGLARIKDFKFDRLFSTRDGLRSNQVTALLKTASGSLYVATSKGLHRFSSKEKAQKIPTPLSPQNIPTLKKPQKATSSAEPDVPEDEPDSSHEGESSDSSREGLPQEDPKSEASSPTEPPSRDETFEPIGDSVPLSILTEWKDGTIWGAGEDGTSKEIVVRLSRENTFSTVKIPHERQLVGLFPESSDKALLVCQGGIFEIDGSKFQALDLTHSPLYMKPPKRVDSERRTPLIWIYNAIQCFDGSLVLSCHTKILTRVRNRSFFPIKQEHFFEIATDPAGGTFFVSDFLGNLHYFDGQTFQNIHTIEDGSLGKLFVDSKSDVWIEEEPHNQPHAILKIRPPFGQTPVQRFELGEGGFYSPGILAMIDDGADGLLISTNAGLWHIRPQPK